MGNISDFGKAQKPRLVVLTVRLPVHALIDLHFLLSLGLQYCAVRNSQIELGAWQANTPVIIGLQEEYQLGEWVRLNCTVPAFQKAYQNSRARQSQMEWYINGERVS